MLYSEKKFYIVAEIVIKILNFDNPFEDTV